MSDQRSVQERQWLASVLPSPQQLDHILGNDPAAALLGLAKTRAPIETGFVGALRARVWIEGFSSAQTTKSPGSSRRPCQRPS